MSDTCELLFELGTEELPPKSLLTLSRAFEQNLIYRLEKMGLGHGDVNSFATPRRLAVQIENLVMSQPDTVVEKRGPALKAAFGNDGVATKAAAGFAASCGVMVDQLGTLKTEKGEWLSFKQEVTGATAADLLPEIIQESLSALPIAKRMRWGDGSAEFARPVHWAVLLLGNQIVSMEIMGVKSSNITYGHRFHRPDAIEIESPSDYASTLYSLGKVVADFEERRAKIKQQATEIAESVGGIAHIEDALLEEVTALVEWPVPVIGKFDQRFLTLPSEVLIVTMQTNQKYFPVKDSHGNLLPFFITISNIESKNPAAVVRGNERVILPRLSDAEFFWAQDRKNSLESRIVSLSHVVFQKKLGTLAEKTKRVEALTQKIAEALSIDPASAKQAAILAKADLLTEMVGEFPSLQGLMGHYYALADGEPEEVAVAIEEQYFPKQAGGALPGSQTGLILSLAEKLDTLSGIFSAGLIPSGDKDPYALRRAAIGIIRIIIEKKLDLDLLPLIQ
ncbi:MAG: glycine--tRNA ligase subunit beta, partial [Methylococcales bacterium]